MGTLRPICLGVLFVKTVVATAQNDRQTIRNRTHSPAAGANHRVGSAGGSEAHGVIRCLSVGGKGFG